MVSLRPLLLAAPAAAAAATTATSSTLNPVPDAAAVVVAGRARFTVLTAGAVRMQLSRTAPNGTDAASAAAVGLTDDPSFVVQNRRLPVPHFAVRHLNETAVEISTERLTLVYDDAGANASECHWQDGKDQHGGRRIASLPNGTHVADVGACCGVCSEDPSCVAFVFVPPTTEADATGAHRTNGGGGAAAVNCYALATVGPLSSAADRQFGTPGSGFTPENLRITVTAAAATSTYSAARAPAPAPRHWDPGAASAGNLNGTYTSLDCYSTPTECYSQAWAAMGPGLVSRDGWTLWDDSASVRLLAPDGPTAVPWWNPAPAGIVDWYFFGYSPSGSGYRETLGTFAALSGPVALPPRAMTAPIWSRYHAYSTDALVSEVLDGYAATATPLGTVVMDMDWHIEPTDKACSSWGQLDFNTTLIPDPDGWIKYLHSNNSSGNIYDPHNHNHGSANRAAVGASSSRLTTVANALGHELDFAVNTHLQGGVDACAHRYRDVAARLGFDVSTNATIPCDFTNESYVAALYDVYFDADPLRGVDWVWADWNGCVSPDTAAAAAFSGADAPAGVGPVNGAPPISNAPVPPVATSALGWANHVMGTRRRVGPTQLRPFLLSRWGGLGAHRYPVGFSGDAFEHELMLDFEIQTTATAANVLQSWSHDVGGFHPGAGAPGTNNPANWTAGELYLRWIQAGAVFPVMRTHTAKEGRYGTATAERRIWMFPQFEQMRDAFYLRASLMPYLYTEFADAAGTGAAARTAAANGGWDRGGGAVLASVAPPVTTTEVATAPAARAAPTAGVLPVHPVYYDEAASAHDEAYSFQHQFFFGEQVLAAPVSDMVDNATGRTAPHAVWLPPGNWSRWDGSEVLAGPQVDSQAYSLAQMPLFARAGALLPLAANDTFQVRATSPSLMWTVWPCTTPSRGAMLGGVPCAGTARVYEDDGVSQNFASDNAFATTSASYAVDDNGRRLALTVAAVAGSYRGMPQSRGHMLQVRGGVGAAAVVSVTVDGTPVKQIAPVWGPYSPATGPGWFVVPADSTSLVLPAGALMVHTAPAAMDAGVSVVVQFR